MNPIPTFLESQNGYCIATFLHQPQDRPVTQH